MNRIATMTLAAGIAGFCGHRQRPAAGAARNANPAAARFLKVEIKTTDLGNNTYMLEGDGGNITIAVGSDAVLMVDSEFAPLHDRIKAAIEKITKLPIKYLVNTHFHGDHTGGNALFHKDGATVVAEINVRTRLAAGTTNGPDRRQDAAGRLSTRCRPDLRHSAGAQDQGKAPVLPLPSEKCPYRRRYLCAVYRRQCAVHRRHFQHRPLSQHRFLPMAATSKA